MEIIYRLPTMPFSSRRLGAEGETRPLLPAHREAFGALRGSPGSAGEVWEVRAGGRRKGKGKGKGERQRRCAERVRVACFQVIAGERWRGRKGQSAVLGASPGGSRGVCSGQGPGQRAGSSRRKSPLQRARRARQAPRHALRTRRGRGRCFPSDPPADLCYQRKC